MKNIIDLIASLSEKNIKIYLQDDKLKVNFPEGKVDQDIVNRLKENKEDIICYIQSLSTEKNNSIEKVKEALSYPLSNGQSRLWILSQFEGGSSAYNMPFQKIVDGTYDIECFKRALLATIDRHEILRTVFKTDENDEPRQWVLSAEEINFEIGYRDYRLVEDKQERVKEYIEADSFIPFDLEKGPLLRACLLQVNDSEYVFYFNMHHIISDGWSAEVLSKDVFAYYEAFKENRKPDLLDLSIQYKDYAAWQLAQVSLDSFKEHQAFWVEKLSGNLPLIDLPGSKLRPKVLTHNGHRLGTYLSKEQSKKIDHFVKEQGGSLFMFLLASWNVLLHRYTANTDIILGTPTAGRDHLDLKDQVGFYVNTLVLRNEIDPSDNFSSFYQKVKSNTLSAYDHQMYPFDRLVEDLNVSKDISRSAVFDVILTLQNADELRSVNHSNLSDISAIQDYGNVLAKFDLDLMFEQEGDVISFSVIYNTDVYESEMIHALMNHYKMLVDELMLFSEKSIGAVNFLSAQERKILLEDFNDTKAGYPEDKTIVNLFEEQVLKTPGNTAVVFEDTKLTYKELDELSNQFAHYLRDTYSIQREDLIGIKLDRSEWMIVSILAVLKAGGAYVPIDPDYPQERIDYIQNDTACKVCVDAVELDRFIGRKDEYLKEKLDTTLTADNLAYVIYTSGSTGNPKGVLIEHCNVVRLLKTDKSLFDFNDKDVWTMFHSYCFDFSVWEMFGALLNGGKLIIVPSMIAKDIPAFVHLLSDQKVTILNQTPSSFYSLIEQELEKSSPELCLRYVIFGGEALSPGKLREWKIRYPDTMLINMYGITETTVHVTYKLITDDEIRDNISNIGKPIPTLTCYVLDNQLNLLPIGVSGELYVGGKGVARGYLNRTELSTQKFIENPFVKGERLYKTGDTGHFLKNGEIIYAGRIDNQVKIRGYRIELGEIEFAIQKQSYIDQVVVLAAEIGMSRSLVAYIRKKSDFEIENLKESIGTLLPAYMIPSYYQLVEKIPLTSNGKVDKHALLSVHRDWETIANVYVSPSTNEEKVIAEIWEKELGREKIGITDDFFELGGDSMRSIRVLSKMNKSLGLNFRLADLYEFGSIKKITAIKSNRLESDIPVSISMDTERQFQKIANELTVSEEVISVFPMSDIETGMIYSSILNEGKGIYHDQFLLGLPFKDFDPRTFTKVINLIVDKHEILRTSFDLENYSVPVHLVYDTIEIDIDFEDLSPLESGLQKQLIQEFLVMERTQNPFNPSDPGLWRMNLYKINDDSWSLLFQCHHAILDGWSIASLFTEINNTYLKVINKDINALDKLSISYRDYVFNQTCFKHFDHYFDYWEDQLKDYSRLDIFTTDSICKTGHFKIQGELYASLKSYAEEHKTSLKTLTFSAYISTLRMLTHHDDILTGIVTSGRPLLEDGDKVLGCFLNTLPFRFHQENLTIQEFVEEIDRLLNAQKQVEVVSLLELHNRFSTEEKELNPFFDVLFNYIDFHIYHDAEISGNSDFFAEDEDEFDFAVTNTFLDLTVNPQITGIDIRWLQQRELKGGLTVHHLQSYLISFLEALVSTPHEILNKENLISAHEKKQLLDNFNSIQVAYPQDQTLVDLFESQVIKNSDAIAVVFENNRLTYKELNDISNQFAHYLRDTYSVQPEDLIGIKLERSEWMIVLILAVLKAGGAYVPIDPDYPRDRIDYIERDTKCKVCIDAFELEKFIGRKDQFSKENLNTALTAGNLAYVIYTSGSTGKPKGVLVEHQSVLNIYFGWKDVYELDTFDVSLLQLANFSFDVSVGDICRSVLTGGTMVICSNEKKLDTEGLYELIVKNKITIVEGTPSLIMPLIEFASLNNLELPSIRTIILGAEAFQVTDLQKLSDYFSEEVTIINSYGVTEATIDNTYYRHDLRTAANLGSKVPIGKPYPNTRVYVLSRTGELQPVGVSGEIYIGGSGLSRGYLNRPELTAEKFISNPFVEGERLYKTGDLGRWLSNGNLEYAGRIDDQVKIRGYRIELGEIEHALHEVEAINSAVVVVKEHGEGEKSLAAYFTSLLTWTSSDLRSALQNSLPDYMIPSYFVQLESIPLTNNGKVDKKSLPDPQELGLSSGVAYVSARNEVEKYLVEIWESVLKRTGIGIHNNFYSLGGDSIKSIQVASRLKQKGYSLKIEHLLRTPVISELGKYVTKNNRVIDQSMVSGLVELTPIQRLFFQDPSVKEPNHYNQSICLKSIQVLDSAILEQSISMLTTHHDALRMVYRSTENGIEQYNEKDSAKSYRFEFYDLQAESQALEVMSERCEALQSGFDLSSGPLFAVGHFRLSDGDRVALICHHLVVDGVSWRILLEDLSLCYEHLSSGSKVVLPSKTDSFQRWASLQKSYASELNESSERSYWESVLSTSATALPVDRNSSVFNLNGFSSFKLGKKHTELLQNRVHQVYRTEINDVLLTCLGLALKDTFGLRKTVIKMEGHGREDIVDGVDISRTVGWFTSLYPFVLEVDDEDTFQNTLVGIKEDLRRIPQKGIGYGILNYLTEGFEDELASQIVFNYLGDFGGRAGDSESSMFEFSSDHIGKDRSLLNTGEDLLNVSGMLVDNELSMTISYSDAHYDQRTLDRLVAAYQASLIGLINELSSRETSELTPSDLSFKGLSMADVSKINHDHELEDVYRLSPLQEGIYYHWLMDPASSMYFEQMCFRFKGSNLDVANFRTAYLQLIQRHDVLRTGFSNEYSGTALQIVRKRVPDSFSYTRLEATLIESEWEARVSQLKDEDKKLGFDLSAPSQIRFHLVEVSKGEYAFIWSHHHILMDGWCTSILVNEFFEYLHAVESRTTANLPVVQPYSNYIDWIGNLDTKASKGYWSDYLKDYSTKSELPFKQSVLSTTYVEKKEKLILEGEIYSHIQRVCSDLGITHNSFIQGVWGYLLSRYNNTNDVVFGAVVSGRPGELEGIESMIGLFINTIPVRIQHHPEDSGADFLKRIHNEAISATSHHYLNLSEVQGVSDLGMDLIDHILIFENYAVQETIQADLESVGDQHSNHFRIDSMDNVESFAQTNYNLQVVIIPKENESLAVDFVYNTDKYDTVLMKNLVDHFKNLIVQLSQRTTDLLVSYDYLSATEKQQILIDFNATQADYSKGHTMVDLFGEQVIKNSGAIAVVFENNRLTYKELDELSNQFAHYLRDTYSVRPEDLIGIKLERSEWMIVSILAILKAGGAYVPIDPDYPQERIDYIEKDTSCKVCVDAYELEKFKRTKDKFSKVKLDARLTPSNLAYVIYTSGSTGKPKGVLIEHKGVVNLIEYQTKQFELGPDEVILLFSSISFDASIEQMGLALLNGYSLCIPSKEAILEGGSLETLLVNEKVTHIHAVPSFLKTLRINESFYLRRIVSGGDVFDPALSNLWQNIAVYNEYGPTETTITAIEKRVFPVDSENKFDIGRPVANTQVYILSPAGDIQAIGVAGEIFIGGYGVARGYLNRSDLTDEKFIASPFVAGERLYKTGDLGRWLPDGNIEFLGRIDDQVKIRGYRIELGEIEHALQSIPRITSSVVLVKETESGDKELIAYFVSDIEQNVSDLRTVLQTLLPVYMIPAHFIQLEEMPLTGNGKIDKKSLTEHAGAHLLSDVEYIAPRNETEVRIIAILAEVLERNKEEIGVNDNFFDLGANSLKVMKITNRLNNEFNMNIKVVSLFQYPNVSEITSQLFESKNEIEQDADDENLSEALDDIIDMM